MAADESMFVKTVLSLNDAFKADDSSLALPSEERLARAADADAAQRRSRRVEQQVQQLTLARKAKGSMMKGSVSISHLNSTAPFRSGPMKVFPPFDHNDASGPSRPVVRMNNLPWASLRLPQVNRGEHGMFRYGSSGHNLNWGSAGFTLPAMRYVSSADHLHGSLPLKKTACPETPRNARPFVYGCSASTLQFPNRPVYEDDLDDVFLPESSHVTALRAEHQKVSWETLQRGDAAWAAATVPLVVPRQEPARRRPSVVSTHTPKMAVAEPREATADTLKNGRQAAPTTMRMAVNLLTDKNQEMQISGANFIQNRCFSSADAKIRLCTLHGIPKLLKLLDSDSGEVQQAAAAALRNVIYENNDNKMEVKEHDGVDTILRLLKTNRDVEARRQLTGLLWNLSSHDMLKEQLGREAVKPVTETVLVPCSGITEGEDPKLELLADPEVFLNATGCLRNVSSAGPNARKSLRDCDGLIDCLVYYVRGTIADYKPDDQALENCVCILHNLTYQFECEVSETFKPALHESRQSAAAETKRPGCLVLRNAKLSDADDVSQAMAHTIVQREGGLQQVKKVLQEGAEDVKRASVCLLKNLSRYKELHSDIIKEVLPELVTMLHASDTAQPVEVTTVCQILNNLSQVSVQNARTVLNNGVLPRIIQISSKERHGSTKVGQAASLLLHTLWTHSELHGSYKKAGYRKTDFINNRTVKAVNSARN
ncbi:plakophilin-2 isoform X4 [Ictalurus furcatus]|uniref:plakophilin-2 isoform X4 n=1 Tax=Ictalurus furcatus TaxID=66913 RepID=UPI0023507818|nr:plakophilin-2 isoform X4 [Ictalurus furcatus]